MAITMAKIGEHTNAPVLELRGLSSDIKPIGFYKDTEIINGSSFLEIDTGDTYMYDANGATWYEVSLGGGGGDKFVAGTNITITDNGDGTKTISASGEVSSEDTVARENIANHKADKTNPHEVTKAQVGLGNVDNTADLDKPLSTAAQTALAAKANSADVYTKSEVDKLVEGIDIPTTLAELTDDATHRVVSDTEKTVWNNKSDFSGSYNDLTNKPTIPDELSDLTEDATHRTVTDTEKATWNAKADAADIPTVPIRGIEKNGTVLTPDASGVVNITVPTTDGLQTELSSTNKLNPAYINYDSTHASVTEAEKASYAGKQNAIDRLHKLASDLVDDTSSTNKFATQAQLSQIETNKNNISLLENDYNMLGELSKIEYTEKSEGACSYYGQKLNLQKNIYVPEYYMDFTISSSSSIQGGAIYGNYYVQFTDKMNSFTIIDLINKNVVQDTTLSPVTTYHCNNANFSNIFYNESDIFPLLYISQENESEHKVLVYRLIGEIGGITLQLIQTITFDAPDICGVYYPNSCVDNDNGLLIQIGYSENSYVKSSTNELVFNVFELPDISNSEVALSDNAKVDTFRLPSLSATQGAFILNGNIYHLFGGGNTERWIKVINIASHQTITSINLNAQTTLYGRTIIAGEQETIFTFDGELYSVGLDKKIYKIATNESNYIPAKKVLSLPKMLNGYSVVADTNGGLICHQVPPIRGTITIKKNDVNKIFALPIGEYTRIGNYKNVDAAAVEIMRTHGLIAIPEGAKSVKLTMTNTSYYYGLVIINRRKDDKTQGNRTYDSGWTLGGNDIIYDLSSLNYNYYEYGIASTFKIGVAGTTNFTDETIESLGWSYEFSF